MTDVHVQPHADRVGRYEIIDLASLVHRHLGVAGARREGAHHHRGAAAHPAKHLGDCVDLLGREGDDRRARRKARQLGGPGIAQSRETRAADDLGLWKQSADHGRQAFRAEDHRLLAAAGMEHPVGEDMAPLRIGAQLRLVDRDECQVAIHRHRFGGAEEPAGGLRQDFLLAGDQRHLVRALQLRHPVVDFARQKPKREADHSARMGAHPLDREIGLARICRPKDGGQRRPGEITHPR
jgi:hypothetical protein